MNCGKALSSWSPTVNCWERFPSVARLLIFLTGAILPSGCVLPGGLRLVGGQLVEGRLADANGRGIPNEQVILVQGHFKKLNNETVGYLDEDRDVYQLDRAVLSTDSEGQFSHKFKGFSHCHPIWIVPPLFDLPSKISGETRHGFLFILKTRDYIYEVKVGEPVPIIRVFDAEQKRLRRPGKSKLNEEILAGAAMIPWTYGNGYTGLVERVKLEIVRK